MTGPAERDRGQSRLLPASAVVPVLSSTWLVVAGVCLLVQPASAFTARAPMPALVLVALFVASQVFVINVQLRREARSVFVSEVPTLLALLSLSAGATLAVRVLGTALGFGLLRRQYRQPQKLLFNTALSAAEAGVATLVFHVLTTAPGAGAEAAWAAAALGAAAASSFTAVGVGLVIDLLEGSVRPLVLLRLAAEAAVQALPVAALGVVGWAAWDDSRWAALPLAAVALIMLLGYRAYAQLRERHLALERLYRFGQVVSHAPGLDEVLTAVLQQAREILHTERARVTFLQDGASGDGVEVVLEGSEPLRRGPSHVLSDAPWALQAFTASRPVFVPRGTRDPEQRAWLERHGLRDSIMVPLLGEAGPIGVLAVDDRLGDARGLHAEDVRVLETVANQASVALRNGELLERLRHESLHDPLTELPNRAQLQRELEQRLRVAAPAPFAVGILDLDAFKEVNDTLGHQEGDRLLCEVARRMVTALSGRALVARLGGDEFAVLADLVADPAAAERLGQQLQEAFDAPVLLGGIEVNVSGSFGIALAPAHGTSSAALMRRADQAMYDAKHAGRQVRVFDPALDTSSLSKLALVAELRSAVESGEIEVHVQPKVDAATGALVGTEALARWSTPARGAVSPADFVPLAERSGLIRPLTELVLDRSIAGCAAWQALAPGVGVSVNVSVRSLADDGLVRLVERLLRRHDLPAHLLTLEITESHIMADPAGTLDVLHQLRARGMRLSVDDFGTGYSSLSYLRRLPVNEVKIDRSFVHRMVDEPEDAAIVRSIVELARTLGLHVVAEGVEDRRTWDALDALGVDEIQGWVVARAMPAEDVGPWAAARSGVRPAA